MCIEITKTNSPWRVSRTTFYLLPAACDSLFTDRLRTAQTFPLFHYSIILLVTEIPFCRLCFNQFSIARAQFYILCMYVRMHELCIWNPVLGCQRSINLYVKMCVKKSQSTEVFSALSCCCGCGMGGNWRCWLRVTWPATGACSRAASAFFSSHACRQ